MKRRNITSIGAVLFTVLAAGAVNAQMQTNTPPAKPKAVWKTEAAAGLTLTSGNSKTTLGTVGADTERKTDQDDWSLGVDGAYGRSQSPGQPASTTTAETLHSFTQYNWLFGDRTYAYGRLEGVHDGVADITYRATISVGAGYYFIKETNTDLSAEAGPAYVIEKLGDVSSSYATLRIGEKFHQSLSDRARIWQSLEFLPQVDKFQNYIVNGEVGIEADLTKDKKFALRSYVTDTFNSEPALGRKKNDMTWVTAIAYKF